MTGKLARYRNEFLENWFSFNGAGMFVIVCLTYMALLFVKRIFIIDTIAAFEVLNERGDIWVFDLIYSIQYLSVPIFLAWKWTWDFSCTLDWLFSCFGYRIHFNQIWKMLMLAEILFFLPENTQGRMVFTFSIVILHTMTTWLSIHFSLVNLIDYTQIAPKYLYPLKSIKPFRGNLLAIADTRNLLSQWKKTEDFSIYRLFYLCFYSFSFG